MSLSVIYQTKIGRQKEIVFLLLHKGKRRCIYGLQSASSRKQPFCKIYSIGNNHVALAFNRHAVMNLLFHKQRYLPVFTRCSAVHFYRAALHSRSKGPVGEEDLFVSSILNLRSCLGVKTEVHTRVYIK